MYYSSLACYVYTNLSKGKMYIQHWLFAQLSCSSYLYVRAVINWRRVHARSLSLSLLVCIREIPTKRNVCQSRARCTARSILDAPPTSWFLSCKYTRGVIQNCMNFLWQRLDYTLKIIERLCEYSKDIIVLFLVFCQICHSTNSVFDSRGSMKKLYGNEKSIKFSRLI